MNLTTLSMSWKGYFVYFSRFFCHPCDWNRRRVILLNNNGFLILHGRGKDVMGEDGNILKINNIFNLKLHILPHSTISSGDSNWTRSRFIRQWKATFDWFLLFLRISISVQSSPWISWTWIWCRTIPIISDSIENIRVPDSRLCWGRRWQLFSHNHISQTINLKRKKDCKAKTWVPVFTTAN